MKDFFISYNSTDRQSPEWIAWQLEEAGYTTVLQAWDFRPGSNFVLEMQRAATEAERTIAVLSPDYLDALYTQPESAAAFARTRRLLVWLEAVCQWTIVVGLRKPVSQRRGWLRQRRER